MINKNNFFKLILIVIMFSLLISCNNATTVSTIKQQKCFTLKYGNFENELNLFDLANQGAINTFLQMKDGFFYITNAESNKILKLNSYGDLIGIYYNPEVNPEPSFIKKQNTLGSQEITVSTQQAIQYPFISLGETAIDTNKTMYVVDQLPPERQEYDTENNLLLRQVILRFSDEGKFIDYLGQEGPGGTPFPYIKNLYTTKNNEIVVTCLTMEGSIIYWFSNTGYLKYQIPIVTNLLPRPNQETSFDYFVSLGTIIPDYTQQKIYLTIDYYTNLIDSEAQVLSGIQYSETLLYTMDIETGLFDVPISIPPYEEISETKYGQTQEFQSYEFLGVTESGWFFLIVPDDAGFLIQIIQSNGQRILKRHFDINHDEILYHDFSFSPEGIISAILAKEKETEIVWWRTDTLIESLIK